jgi:NadR type nicotinamide-nucleotide adenylyltransferase
VRRWSHGLVIGKFLPPHRGHNHLIGTALAQVDRLSVIVCDKPEMRPEGRLRAEWLREVHPTAEVILIEDRLPDVDSYLWAENTKLILGESPDVVFTSEDYGEPYARFLGCDHVLVDRERIAVPCSGTLVRSNPLEHLDFLAPCVRAHYVLRIAIMGAESTGTTTLAQSLAEAYGTGWVEEYGREYWMEKVRLGEEEHWTEDEFVHIAQEQRRREDLVARTANRILFCDTDAFATSLWYERYLGQRSARVEAVSADARYALTFVTGAEIPFVQDGWRDGEHIRLAMHERFLQRLREEGRPFVLIEGSPETRLAEAKRWIDAVLTT